MSTQKTLLYSFAIAIVSLVVIAFSRGTLPPGNIAFWDGVQYFIVSFIVLRVFYTSNNSKLQ